MKKKQNAKETILEIEVKKELKKGKRKQWILLSIFFLLIFLLLISVFLTPTISLKGKTKTILSYPDHYKELGYKARFYGQDLTKNVKVKGKVNDKKIGKYTVEYSIKKGIFTRSVTRTVVVKDEESPKITLKGNEDTFVCPGKEYKEEGYEARDNYDGDITKSVKIKIKEDEILYRVSDSSKNRTEKKRKLTYKDEEKPKIQLKGGSPLSITVGGTFTEPGYEAIDNCDGDITKNVKVEGSVDTGKVGTYNLTYTVKDEAGNEEKVERKVNISSARTGGGCGTLGAIYLTFDDGPQNGSTTKILDVLKQENVKATFFVTGHGPDNLIKREYDEGHTVALHTNSHNYATVYASQAAYFNDLEAVRARVKRITGYTSKFVRFPGGSSNVISKRYSPGIMTSLTKEVVNRGFLYYDWNVDSNDAGKCASTPNANCVYTHVVQSLSKNKCNMVLMHDVKNYTADAIQSIIKYGKENGYSFMAITENTPMVKHGVNN